MHKMHDICTTRSASHIQIRCTTLMSKRRLRRPGINPASAFHNLHMTDISCCEAPALPVPWTRIIASEPRLVSMWPRQGVRNSWKRNAMRCFFWLITFTMCLYGLAYLCMCSHVYVCVHMHTYRVARICNASHYFIVLAARRDLTDGKLTLPLGRSR